LFDFASDFRVALIKNSQPELELSSGGSRSFFFSSFNQMWDILDVAVCYRDSIDKALTTRMDTG